MRSFGKLLAEGVAPPPVLLYVTGLQASVVIDGHDRISAATNLRVPISCIELAPGLAENAEFRTVTADAALLERLATNDPANADGIAAVAKRISDNVWWTRTHVPSRAWVADAPPSAWPW